MKSKIRLHVLGLSCSQLQSGAYALVLAEEHGPRRIPVVIGPAEAQSIAIVMEGIRTPRPLTHDLFVSFAHAFGVKLTEVFIYRFEDGIFSSELTFTDGNRTVVIDARTSDAISIALRTRTPIYTTPEIVESAGFVLEDDVLTRSEEHLDENEDFEDEFESYADDMSYHANPKIENYTIEELERTLSQLIEQENYEEAAHISDILKRKKGLGGSDETTE